VNHSLEIISLLPAGQETIFIILLSDYKTISIIFMIDLEITYLLRFGGVSICHISSCFIVTHLDLGQILGCLTLVVVLRLMLHAAVAIVVANDVSAVDGIAIDLELHL